MKRVLIATKNRGKVKEFEQLLHKHGIRVHSLLDVADTVDVEETGTTFAENAILKAETISRQYGETVLADDSGLMIDALDGRPGVYSARYAGDPGNDEANIDQVLNELKGVSLGKRTAQFVCVLAATVPGERTATFVGRCDGLITRERAGKSGFGYDPIFYLPGKGKTMAELTPSEKNSVSHRSAALKELMENWDYLYE